MLPVDNSDNTIINSALQSGRKLILSDAGKQLISNYPKVTNSDIVNTIQSATDDTVTTYQNAIKPDALNKRKTSTVIMSGVPSKSTTPLKTNKIIKILSAEEFNKMCGGKVPNNAFKKVTTGTETLNNGSIR